METSIPENTLEGIKAALFRGEKIKAVKLYRENTNVGLAEAKAAVEKLEDELRGATPEKFAVSAGILSDGSFCLDLKARSFRLSDLLFPSNFGRRQVSLFVLYVVFSAVVVGLSLLLKLFSPTVRFTFFGFVAGCYFGQVIEKWCSRPAKPAQRPRSQSDAP
ncbi:MAG: hypothetical protein ABIV39_16450 [Verrucomicrobiota bacterium]